MVMAYFAEIQNNVVTGVISVNDTDVDNKDFPESEPIGQAFIAACGIPGDFLQCSITGEYRGAYPGPGFTWDGSNFAAPAAP
jgi:hypothetical protein